MNKCIFCNIPNQEILAETDYSIIKMDNYPVNAGHTLIIPKRHVESYFDLYPVELEDIQEAIQIAKEIIDDTFTPDGYNIGVNIGSVAGQTINHAHVHLIPRYKDDIENPRGGIRNFKKPLVEY